MSLVKWFKQITYKPEVELRFDDDGRFCRLTISRFVLDARSKKDRIQIAAEHREMSKRFKDAEHLHIWVYQHIKTFEIHETNEWFQINGKMLLNPHLNEGV